jgi:altronate hydrolase/galactarate dehydratase
MQAFKPTTTPMEPKLIRLHPADNVLVSFSDLEPYQRGFKYAAKRLEKGTPVIKLGNEIGCLTSDVEQSELIHTHNIETGSIRSNKKTTNFSLDLSVNDSVGLFKNPRIGRYATRKNLLIISTVSCVNRTVLEVAREFEDVNDLYTRVIPITHNTGCGLVVGSEDHRCLQSTIYGYTINPNTFHVAIIGLGCEDNQFSSTDYPSDVHYYSVQELGEPELIRVVSDTIRTELRKVVEIKPENRSLGDICFALQCGGSDSFSGITANPLLGYTTSSLLKLGAAVILSETPEVRGFEECLLQLCKHVEDKEKLANIFREWDMRKIGTNNPAPGNFSGGISTNLEKSIGAIQKFGFNQLDQVLRFAEIPRANTGMIFMDSPGYDPCSISGQISSGATCLIFTTGRGSNYKNSFLPTIKIGSNTLMSKRHPGFIDVDAEELMASYSLAKAVSVLIEIIVESINIPKQDMIIHSDFVPWLQGGMN